MSDTIRSMVMPGPDRPFELPRQADVGVSVMDLRRDCPQDRQRIAFSQATHPLTALTRGTCGEVSSPNPLLELDAVHGRLAEELRSQYRVVDVSRNDRREGKWRPIVVRMPAREELRTRHQLGYYAAKG